MFLRERTDMVMIGNIKDDEKLLQYLFLNLAYLLDVDNDKIVYGDPQYSSAEKGFSITMFRIDHKAYDYAEECFRILGKDPVRECGVTMSVNFDTSEENDEFRDNFKMRVDQAEERLSRLLNKTPQEYYFLKTNPIIKRLEDTPNNHFIYLLADVVDDVDRLVCGAVLGDHEIVEMGDEKVEIKVLCYRKKWRYKMVRYLTDLDVEDQL